MKRLFNLFSRTNLKTYFLSIASSIIGIGLNFFLAHVLQAEAYGEIQYLVSISTTISNFLLFGLSSFLIKESKNINNKNSIINKCFSLYFAIVIFLLPILYFVLSKMTLKYNIEMIMIIIILVVAVFMGINSMISSYYQGLGKYHISIIFESLLPKLVLFILAIIFTLIGKITNFQANYLYCYAIIYGTIAILFAFRLFKKIDFSFTKGEIKSIVYFFGVTITYTLSQNLTKVLQGGLYDNKVALAIISVSLSIISIVSIFTNVINSITKPIYAKYSREGNKNEILSTYQLNTRVNCYISIPFYIFFLTQGERFLYLFGSSYLAYPNILTILSIYSMVSCITGPNGSMLAMTGKEKWELINGIVYLLVFLLCAYLFSNDKIYGLCLSLLIGDLIVNILKYIEVWVLFKKSPLNLKTLLTIAIIFVVDFAIIFFLKFIDDLLLWLAIGLFIGVLAIIINFSITPFRKSDLKTILDLSI